MKVELQSWKPKTESSCLLILLYTFTVFMLVETESSQVMADSRTKSVQNLAETLHSLLGLNSHLTSNWLTSVCDIIKTLPSVKSNDFKPTNPFDAKDDDDDSAGSAVSKIKDELAVLTTQINQLNTQRRQILNDFLDLKGNIRVFCRVRPITLGENFGCLRPVVALDSDNILLKLAAKKSKSYNFDRVFHPGSSQDEVFMEVEPVIKSVLDGYNACIFAYGQTGTGKTFTMEGSPNAPGIVPRAIEALFKQAADSNLAFLISFSMLEIYMGNMKDLLILKPTKATDPVPPCLSIQTDPEGGIEINNLVAIQVNDFNQALKLYRLGCRFRSTASTNSNMTSSRSHCMIRIAITCLNDLERRKESNKIWLIDLGGSERILKTKALGKRLEEGKAINLSLSALGDVINALQRRKRHIPYRNSKLTQVLKDSLGDDSRTLMLVHVSPKEEDLCETICTLNFATRVKRIHLGYEDTIEAREKKELATANLRQKMKQIEKERLHVRTDIERLNKKLENLKGISSSSEDQFESHHGSTEEPLTKDRIGDITSASFLKLPRFMRPTICSRRKSRTSFQAYEETDPIFAGSKKPSSHRAESVTLPVKDHSEYNSEHSISRSSCLLGLNVENHTDNATEYSQETSEIDAKVIDLQEEERETRTSTHPRTDIRDVRKNGNRQMQEIKHTKFLKVDNWLHMQKNEPTIREYSHRTKHVVAVPTCKKKHGSNGYSKAENFCDKEENNYDFGKQKIVNHDRKDNLVVTGGIGKPISEMVTDRPPILSKNLFNEDSRSDVTSLSQITEGKTMIQTQDSVDNSSIEDDKGRSVSSPDGFCGRLEEFNDNDKANAISIMQAAEYEIQYSENFLLKSFSFFEHSRSNLGSSITYLKRDSRVTISTLENKSCCQPVSTTSDVEDGKQQDFCASCQPSTKESYLDLLQLRSQRSLFLNKANQDDAARPFDRPQGKTQTTGLFNILKQKIEILCAITLLGLGFYNLGFEQEFFYGLML